MPYNKALIRERLTELVDAYSRYDDTAESREELRFIWRGTGILIAAPIIEHLGYDVSTYVLDVSRDAVTVTILYSGAHPGWGRFMVTLAGNRLAVNHVACAGYRGVQRIIDEAVSLLPTIEVDG